ncbi:MAG: N-acetylmuramoyl-L-alanine amidase [Bacteroidota bacterium]
MSLLKSASAYILVVLICGACTRPLYTNTNRSYKKQVRAFSKIIQEYPLRDSFKTADQWVGTTNFSMRKPNYVIIHHTAQDSTQQTLRTFTLPRTKVSSHYVIGRDGAVYHMLNDLLRAQHAGVSKWGSTTDLNSSSIGIELDNNGKEPFAEEQINSLLLILEKLQKAYSIPTANFLGHADVAPGRKVDPSRYFPWENLAKAGFGIWYDTTKTQVPTDFNMMQGLRIIGYNTANEKNAIHSYRIHFTPNDTTKQLHDGDRKIIWELMKKR